MAAAYAKKLLYYILEKSINYTQIITAIAIKIDK